ncbi:hypothetical protein RvY_12001 [Ramazzottius varieornatus]|uniref:Uncharacterized protein n=1 Tax=Ramazzottius varieornatus TaxID=947166 RepID=A0A1D1VI20_RAMVA|nr:hypothetical protein RvY_12001 [Ramazzottius varieornatus]
MTDFYLQHGMQKLPAAPAALQGVESDAWGFKRSEDQGSYGNEQVAPEERDLSVDLKVIRLTPAVVNLMRGMGWIESRPSMRLGPQ